MGKVGGMEQSRWKVPCVARSVMLLKTSSGIYDWTLGKMPV